MMRPMTITEEILASRRGWWGSGAGAPQTAEERGGRAGPALRGRDRPRGQREEGRRARDLSLTEGPSGGWNRAVRSIRLDAFEPDYKSGGIDRGAVPTVSILDGAGTVLVKQRVYPNNMLHAGSLAINAPGVGLSVWLALLDPAGAETGRVVQYVDFSETAPEGTVADRALLPRHPHRVQDDPRGLHRRSRRLSH